MRHALAARLTSALLVAAGVALVPGVAHADGRVSVANSEGTAVIDPTYATTLRVSGSGFQSIKGGHGGIYVMFGTVRSGWQPSKGGITGVDYFYVPDSEAKNNQGFLKYVAFPGSDTASSANGGVMSSSGSWSTQLVVPGATFKAYDRHGKAKTIDCAKVTCGVFTIGAHGVSNSHNETFTPVRVESLAGSGSTTATPDATTTDEPSAAADPTADASATTVPTGKPTLEVDREAAIAGNVLSFTATGLPAGAQVSAVFDDGAAGSGPFAVGADGQVTGVITLPSDTGPGTHELRLYGVDDPPSVKFAVQASDTAAATTATGTETQTEDDDTRAAWVFAGVAALVLLLALGRLGLGWRKARRAT